MDQHETEQGEDERPLPLVLRIAAKWIEMDEAPRAGDGALFFRERAALSGELALTDNGQDVQFSDLEVLA
ncbi:MAG: hypothetical protein WCD76_03120 [Pyrinomonadaceae bacterium]